MPQEITANIQLSSQNLARVDFFWRNDRCLTRVKFAQKPSEQDQEELEESLQAIFTMLGVRGKRILTIEDQNKERALGEALRFLHAGTGNN